MRSAAEASAKQVVVERSWCKGCGICVDLCPKQALALDSAQKAVWQSPEKCVRCGLCQLRCPDLAIELAEGEQALS